MNRQLAGRLTGRVTKWVVLVVWLLVAAGAAMFAAKLADVQNNEASSWLPESAESTRAFEKLEPFQDPNAIPTVVVYHRASGLTAADLDAIEAQAVDFAAMDGLAEAKEGRAPSVVSPATAEQLGFPALSDNGEVGADLGDLRPRLRGLEQDAGHRRRAPRHRRDRRRRRLHRRRRRPGGRLRRGVRGHRHDPASPPPSASSSSSCCSPIAAPSCGSCRSSAPSWPCSSPRP